MNIIVTLDRYTPPARADGIPFVQVRIEEAAAASGPWTTIDTLALAPVDTDPEHPLTRDLTTRKGTLEQGFYRVTWIDGVGNASAPSAAVQNLSELAGGVRPSVAEVAGLLRARTIATGGAEVGTFNANTRPTDEEVDELIEEALDDVLGKVKTVEEAGLPPGSDYERRVRGAVRLYAAILIETSYFPEQIRTGQSAVATYEKLYESRIKALIAEGETGAPQGEGGEGAGGMGGSPADAAWTFPTNLGGLVGWGTRW